MERLYLVSRREILVPTEPTVVQAELLQEMVELAELSAPPQGIMHPEPTAPFGPQMNLGPPEQVQCSDRGNLSHGR
ncbi:hypothetical protein ABVT39_016891 [Epinephelus coioides]